MPFDASYQPPPPIVPTMSPQESQAKALTLRNAVMQGQINQQQLQSGALDLQQKQIEMKDQATMRQAYMDSGGDMNKFQQLVMQRGASPKAIAGIQQQILANQEAHAKLDDQQLKNEKAKVDAFGAGAQSLLALPDEPNRAAQWPALRMQLITQGHISPAEVPEQYPGEQFLQIHRNLAVTAQQSIENTFKDREAKAAEDRANAAGKQADTAAAKQANESGGQIADATQKQVAGLAPQLEAAFKQGGPDAVNALLDQQPHGVAKRFVGAAKPGDFLAAALNPEQATQANQANKNAAETNRHNLETEGEARKRTGIEQQNASINAKKFAMEFGGDAVKGWAKQVADNPDTANQVPPALRTPVSQAYTASTGLPFPKPLAGPAVDQERAAHNALKAVQQITEALQDPEIQSRRGPVLGRIGNVEQDAGATVGLSPSAASKAAELRSNLRYLFTQELKANIGGRPPVELAKALEAVSPNIKLDDALMQGSLAGVKDAAMRTLDATDEQRFGSGKTRTREARGLAPGPAAAPGVDPSQNPFRKNK